LLLTLIESLLISIESLLTSIESLLTLKKNINILRNSSKNCKLVAIIEIIISYKAIKQ
jgi:hypothetical protein